MTAPKPRVRFRRGCDGSGLWAWDCGCGFGSDFWHTSLMVACESAAYHSRTHAAERIADELDRLRADARNLTWIDNLEFAAYHRGLAGGCERAANLIREHLT